MKFYLNLFVLYYILDVKINKLILIKYTMIIDFVKLHIAEALSEVANNYGNEEYLNEVVTINFDQLVEDIFNGLNGYFTRDAWPSVKDVIYTMLLDKKTLDGIVNVIKGMMALHNFDIERAGGIIRY